VTTTLPIGLDHAAHRGPPRDLLKVYSVRDDVADKVAANSEPADVPGKRQEENVSGPISRRMAGWSYRLHLR
jgi:hypothetical protein